MIIQGPRGERRISANDFFIDLYTTSLEPDEILVATEMPIATGSIFSDRTFRTLAISCFYSPFWLAPFRVSKSLGQSRL
jgi:CO/xanthine dehydrogenase FAD-binding subunit